MKNLQTLADKLSDDLATEDWFYLAVPERDHLNVIVAWMNKEVFTKVPDHVDGVPVKLTFQSYLDDKYAIPTTLHKPREDFDFVSFSTDDDDYGF